MAKGKKGGFALKGGDAQSGTLTTLHEGNRPPGYETMKKQGAIILGIGGDNSCSAVGTFYEGAMTATYTSDATDVPELEHNRKVVMDAFDLHPARCCGC